jgi:two-component system, OmpR family, sensor kinase
VTQPRSDQSLLQLLQSLLDLPALDLRSALTAATTYVAEWLQCDKVDAFFLDERRSSLVAQGTSRTPLGERQKALGLDVLPLANGGLIVETFKTGVSQVTGRADLDGRELVGIVQDLRARSEINVVLEIAGLKRGVLAVLSQEPDRFTDSDSSVVELVARWIGALAQRAELVEKLRMEESARTRLATAERIITILSHDIRNHLHPLTARLHALQLKLQQGQTIEAAAIEPTLLAARRLARLTSRWLDVSRLDQGLFELELEPLDLCAVLRETASALSSPKAEIRVEGPSQLTMIGDAERLRQAFENVLANAVRYSPAGLAVQVTVAPRPLENLVQVVVRDQGPGIAAELLPHLFERFVTSGSTGAGGIGLGLYLSERIVTAHGGSLRAESTAGFGASFHFELPLDANSRERIQPRHDKG